MQIAKEHRSALVEIAAKAVNLKFKKMGGGREGRIIKGAAFPGVAPTHVLSVLDFLFEARGAGCSLAKIWLPAASIKHPCDDGNDKSLSSFGRYLHCSCGLLVRDTWSHGSAQVMVVSRVIT